MKNLFMLFILLVFTQPGMFAQNVVHLYQKVPNSIATGVIEKRDTSKTGRITVRNVTDPTLTVFLPEKKIASGTAVVICPGGGYSFLVENNEGTDVAKELVKHGIAAFVLKYRLPDGLIMKDRSIGPLQDAEQAIRLVREGANEWGIDTAKVGIMGFSAGGHLASTASTHYAEMVIDNPKGTNLRPDFSILIYPVISFQDGILHKGSKKALIGEDADRKKTDAFSNELWVDEHTPPAFLIHCNDDKVVPALNSIYYYEALKKNNVKAEMHIYATGGHGFGLKNAIRAGQWVEQCLAWLKEIKMN